MMLANLQAELAESLLSEHHPATEVVAPTAHLAIYRNNIRKNFVAALSDIYPLLLKLLGKDYFTQVAKEYVQYYPCRSSNLHDYGEYLPEFIGQFPVLDNFPYLIDIARFEWICHILHFAADATAMALDKLEKIAPEHYEELYFTLHPATGLEKFDWPVLQIMELSDQELQDDLIIDKQTTYLHIMRRDQHLFFTPLSKAEYTFLTAVQNNVPLKRALELTLSIDSNFQLDANLPRWVQEQVLVDCWV